MMSGITAVVAALGGWSAVLQYAVGLPALIGSIMIAWKKFKAQKSLMNALELANVSASATMAGLNMVKSTPQIEEAKRVIQQIQQAIGTEQTKQTSLLGTTKQVLASVGIGDPQKAETETKQIALAARAIIQSERIRADGAQ